MTTKRRLDLPPHTYRDKVRGTYYRPYLGRHNGKPRFGKRVRLGDYDLPAHQAWAKLETLQAQATRTVRWVLTQYLNSPRFKELAPKTQRSYEDSFNSLTTYPLADGRSFGDAPLEQINKRVIRRFLDHYPYPVAANRQVALLKAAWRWVEQRYEGIPENPCTGVDANRERPRERYVTDWEYEQMLGVVPPWLWVAMELSYLCRGRKSEVLALTRASIQSNGIYLQRAKGSDDEVTLWSERLKEVIRVAAELPGPSEYLVRNRGGRVTKKAFDSAWARAKRKAGSAVFPPGDGWTFHDIKAKGYSDQREQSAGHRSERMHRVYSRKAREVEPPK